MKPSDFLKLTPRQQHTLVLAMLVRNYLEDFHVAHVPDVLMKELNSSIRYAIYDAVDLLETMENDRKKQAFFGLLIASIPEYWEVPGQDPRPNGKPVKLKAA